MEAEVNDQPPEFVTGSALGDLDMILHDIAQYLSKLLGDARHPFDIPPPWANPDDGLKKTEGPVELLRRARLVKDMAMRLAGYEPLEWGVGY
ncbi:hypothetical protein LCGC14_1383000 [marine sediment metagenome]|uniref:Uncharacterized protein n=1 Tax=marine sediment metagenome TaxID=412755 RepID=A0A0F9KMY2_9ZZZZ